MTTNQTIDGVPRATLANFIEYSLPVSGNDEAWLREKAQLRALLDAPANPLGDPVGSFDKHMQYMHENIELKKRISDLEAAQPRGVPVAWMFKYLSHSDSPPYRSFEVTDFHQNPKAPGIAEHTPLYAEQPAPVALVLPEHRDSDLRSPTYGLARGWNACLDEVVRLTATVRTPEPLVMTDDQLTNDWRYVTCKRCLKIHEKELAARAADDRDQKVKLFDEAQAITITLGHRNISTAIKALVRERDELRHERDNLRLDRDGLLEAGAHLL